MSGSELLHYVANINGSIDFSRRHDVDEIQMKV